MHGIAVLLAVALTSACASTGGKAAADAPADPPVVSSLPPSIASFDFDGYKYFDDDSGGYSFRYSNPKKKRLADVYVYPVADENRELEHKQLVLGSTRATIEAIGEAVDQGLYANFDVLGAATRANGLRTTARVHATYLRENLASFTLLYQTEQDGMLMKIRLTMPDNDSNRENGEWDAFAEQVFALVIDSLPPDSGREAALEGAQARASGV